MIRCLHNRSLADIRAEALQLAKTEPGESEGNARSKIARRYGFLTWRQLEVYLLDTREARAPGSAVDLTQISCLNYFRRTDTDLALAARLVNEESSLAQRDLYHAACIGDVEALEAFVRTDPGLVNRRGGYFDWEPLLYACYSRLALPGKSTREVARLLLQSGADPNVHFWWGGQYKFTALCGVFAEGEDGPGNYPEHPECESFARLLLQAGADPNDGQALYNRMFTPGSLCLELMLEFGLKPEDRCNWLLQDGGNLVPNAESTMDYQLKYAVKAGFSERARLLVKQGASVATPPGERSLYESALLMGDPELADWLVHQGAPRPELSPATTFAAACMCGEEARARALLAEDPSLLAVACSRQPDLLDTAAETGRYDVMRLLVRLGADLNTARSPLFTAVWHGDLAMVKLLIELGADPNVRDRAHNATPLQWAQHHGDRGEILGYLAPLSKA